MPEHQPPYSATAERDCSRCDRPQCGGCHIGGPDHPWTQRDLAERPPLRPSTYSVGSVPGGDAPQERPGIEYALACPCDCDCPSLGDCLDLDAARWPDPAHPEKEASDA